jgi:phosphoribosylformylglycinamidine (FGAM) synthase PurS component
MLYYAANAIFLRCEPSGIQRRVVSLKYTNVSDVHTASIIRLMMQAVSQKAAIFILAAVRTDTLTVRSS